MPPAIMKWEYATCSGSAEYTMQQLGKEGWELVAVTSRAEGAPSRAYFKRPLITPLYQLPALEGERSRKEHIEGGIESIIEAKRLAESMVCMDNADLEGDPVFIRRYVQDIADLIATYIEGEI